MQKINKNGSVLIWAIFLSLIISISFLSISTKINENLRTISTNIKNIEETDKIKYHIENSEKNIENVGNKSIFMENKKLDTALKNNEIYEVNFTKNSVISLEIKNNSMVFYELVGTKNDSGILTGTLNNYETGKGVLKIHNYSGYSKISLISENKFEIKEKKYKIIENIGVKELVKTRGIIK